MTGLTYSSGSGAILGRQSMPELKSATKDLTAAANLLGSLQVARMFYLIQRIERIG